MTYVYKKEDAENLLEVVQADDVVEIRGEDFVELLKEKTNTAGRKPIEIDLKLFNEIAERWRKGEITATDAMKSLNLKPNTFYRRIKEKYNTDIVELKSELEEVKKQLHEEVKDVKQAVEEKKQVVDVKREMYQDKLGAKIEHVEDMIAMRREVEKEAREFKNNK